MVASGPSAFAVSDNDASVNDELRWEGTRIPPFSPLGDANGPLWKCRDNPRPAPLSGVNGSICMNKSELIDSIAGKAGISRAAAGTALEATLASISEALVAGDAIALVGFGTFKVSERAARTGKNPATGATLEIAASKSAKFTPGKALKDALNA